MDSDNNLTLHLSNHRIFAPLNNSLKYYASSIKYVVFALVLVVFILDFSSSTFAKSIEKAGFVCELDVDADESVEKDLIFPIVKQNCTTSASLLHTKNFIQELSSCDGFDITNSFSLHLFRKRCVSLQTLKLFC